MNLIWQIFVWLLLFLLRIRIATDAAILYLSCIAHLQIVDISNLFLFVVFHPNDTSYIRSFRHTVAHRVTPLIRSFFLSFRTQFQFIAECTTAQKSMGDNIEMEEKKTQNEWTISNCIKCNYMFLFSRKMKLCAIVHAIQLLRRSVQWFRTIWIATVYWMVCGVLSFAWE